MKHKMLWCLWCIGTVGIGLFFANKLWGDGEQETFLIGETTYGHYQIEMACQTCHTEAFGGDEVLQNACTQCHADELKEALDAHPKSKFTNPRNADRVEVLDARYCITCHQEHKQDQTHAMGLTLPEDYCYHCHQETLEERESHKDLAFDSCATSGCHNYHDNRALYESFLVENAEQHWLQFLEAMQTRELIKAKDVLERSTPVDRDSSAYQNEFSHAATAVDEWHASSHAQAGVDCGGCHEAKGSDNWLQKPGLTQCQNCHEFEASTFLQGKHGMRLSGELSATLWAMQPGQSHMKFQVEAETLEQGCNACHGAHEFSTQSAATKACLSCHADEHSLAFPQSPHAALVSAQNGEAMVTCASCHMPREELRIKGKKVMAVNHNQNHNLRPNEKMIRSVCMDCHGLAFSIDALADPALIQTNFIGQPSQHIPSIDWATQREKKKAKP